MSGHARDLAVSIRAGAQQVGEFLDPGAEPAVQAGASRPESDRAVVGVAAAETDGAVVAPVQGDGLAPATAGGSRSRWRR